MKIINYLSKLFQFLLIFCTLAVLPLKAYAEPEQDPDYSSTESYLTEVLIKGLPFQSPLKDAPVSATVIKEKTIELFGDDHFQNVISQVPNLNFAGGTARPRFFQIRGIGELEQYEVAPNPSVGFYIDGIDMSGIGSIASLFDVDQVEVLKGPQSIGYGANALAGVIDLHSKDPTSYSNGKAELGFGSDEMYEGGAAYGGPIIGSDEKLLFRVSAYHHYNDGFRDNDFTGTDDTNKREETTYRAKLHWLPTKDFSAELNYFGVNADDGYDVFNIENTFTTHSDRPGVDNQDTNAGALKLKYKVDHEFTIESFSSLSDNDSEYSYDGDWGNNPYWGQFAPYDYFSDTFRQRHVFSQQLKLASDDENYSHGESYKWVSGVYFQRLEEDSNISQQQDGVTYDQLISDYSAKTGALFGQIEMPLRKGTSFVFGLRAEKRKTDYFDSKGGDFEPEDNMYGGNVSLNQDLSKNVRIYGLVSRGFKGGGFNANPDAPADRKQYDPEYLWNYETGLKANFLDNRLQLNIAAFYDYRKDVQVKLALQNDPSDPLSFLYLTDNAAGGKNLGLESDMLLQVSDKLSFAGSSAILSTEFDDYSYPGLELSGRDQSHAPHWQYSAGPYYSFTDNLFAAANISGKDSFYFDDSNNIQSNPYHLVNLNAGYKTKTWSWTIWARNVFDEEYATRGFFFGNEPPDFPNKKYVDLGDPRTIGTTFTLRF
jgi:iron complex outermembrane receptor protein